METGAEALCSRFNLLKTELSLPSSISLSRQAADRLVAYADLILRWTNKVDLVAPATREELLERHIVDSIAGWCVVEKVLSENREAAILDIGSGAGLPGLVIGCASQRRVYLCEPREKRVVFLKEARRLLGLKNVSIIDKRVEDITPSECPQCGLAISRAVGMEDLLKKESQRLLEPPALLALMISAHQELGGVNYPYRIGSQEHRIAVLPVSRETESS